MMDIERKTGDQSQGRRRKREIDSSAKRSAPSFSPSQLQHQQISTDQSQLAATVSGQLQKKVKLNDPLPGNIGRNADNGLSPMPQSPGLSPGSLHLQYVLS